MNNYLKLYFSTMRIYLRTAICLLVSGIYLKQGIKAQPSLAKIDQIVNQYIKPNESGGVLLLARGDKILHHKAYGLASKELNIPMKTVNTFRIASMTKQFVAVCILTLEEQGKLSLEDDIRKYVPEFPDKGETIRIKHLLSHTSGIKNLTSIGNYPEYMKKVVTLSELISYFKNEPLEFVPGSKNSYSNSGYILLHHIIEKLSGMSLNDYMQKYLFGKIGVTTARVEADNEIIPNKASGYINEHMTADYMSMTQIACLVMCAEDMFRWHRGLYAGKIISKQNLQKAQSGFRLNDGTYTDYGFGWGIKVLNGDTLIEHGGGISGYGGYEVYLPKEDIFAVFLDNSQSRPEDLILYKAISAVSKSKLINEIHLTTEQRKKYIGQYQFGDTKTEIVEKNGRLYLNGRYKGASWPIRFTALNTFYIEEQYPFEYTFITDENDKITEIILKGRGGYEERAKRIN